ncbi:MAG: IS66 family transposase [Gammaproteobacteria bacterium]|nr:IS66 family transposase [Gammaproteobacteria bacterium]
MLFEVLIAVFMERNTRKTDRNSSIPSSQTGKDESATTKPGRKSNGNQQNDALSSHTRTVETIEVVTVDACQSCGADLSDTPSQPRQRRTLIDIIFEKVVHHVEVEVKHCDHCNRQSKGSFPVNMPGPLQYGDGIKAYVLNLLIAQMISLDRVQKSLKTLIGVVISPATILKSVSRLAAALERWETSAMAELLSLPTLHADETSLRVDRKNHWIHVYSGGDITIKCLHQKRGCEAIEDIGIIPRYGGVVVHDCWASYLSYDHCDHALCGSHLLRELQFIVDSNQYAWAANMKRALQQTCAKVSARKRKKLTEREYQALQKRYRNILTRGSAELPPVPVKPKGKRGRIAKSDAHNLWERLKQHEKAVLMFAKHSHVPFTNNRAERDLRMSKVKQKVSGCFRTEHYAQAYCRISSYLQTMGNRGYNPLVAIQLALSGKIYELPGE